MPDPPRDTSTAGGAGDDLGSDRSTIGLIVNPIAGMGGPVALKGTDDAVDEAVERGAEPVSPGRARRFLEALDVDVEVRTCSAPMGADVCRDAGLDCEVVVEVDEPTSAGDTRRAARALVDAGVDLLCFVGGDGTALDVAEAIDHEVVCLGVPGGVKMNSAVFGATPERAARAAADLLAGRGDTHVVEIVEVDERRLREGAIERATLGSLIAPDHCSVQAGKAEPGGTLDGIAQAGEDLAEPGSTLVLGPGSTVQAIKRALVGEGTTLLGVDVVTVDERGRANLVLADARADQLEDVPDDATLVVSPIGGQGFVLGRGNQQVVPDLLARIGWGNLVVVATAEKLGGLDALHADTGDPALDERAPGRLDVLTGPGFRRRMRLRAGASHV